MKTTHKNLAFTRCDEMHKWK